MLLTLFKGDGAGLGVVNGNLSATESGSDVGAITAKLLVKGSSITTETGSDTIAMIVKVSVKASISATETESDIAAITGKILVGGSISATETESDIAAITGNTGTSGSISATETESDIAAITGKILVGGSISATETESDIAAITGNTGTSGSISATETESDIAAITGKILVGGSISATETEQDIFAGSVSTAPAIEVIKQYGRTAATYTLGVFLYDEKILITAEPLSSLSVAITYVSKTKASSIYHPDKATAEIISPNTALDVYFTTTKLSEILTYGKIDSVAADGIFLPELERIPVEVVQFSDSLFRVTFRDIEEESEILEIYETFLEKPLTDTYTTEDYLDTQTDYYRDQVDFTSISSDILINMLYDNYLSDQYSTVDQLSNTTVKSLEDQYSISDSFTYVNITGVIDQFVTQDLLTTEYTKVVIDQYNISDIVSTQLSYFKDFADEYNVSDLVSNNPQKVVEDSYSITDNTIYSIEKIVLDPASISDNLSRIVDFNPSIIDQLNLSDNIGETQIDDGTTFKYSKDETDQYFISDIQYSLITKPVIDQYNIADQVFSDIAKIVADQYNISDSLNRSLDFYRDQTDQSNILDIQYSLIAKQESESTQFTESNITSVNKIVQEQTNIQEIVDKQLDKLSIDYFNIGSSISTQKDFFRDFSETNNISDIARQLVSKSTQEEFNVSDTYVSVINFLRQPVENPVISDQLVSTTDFLRNPTDVGRISDNLNYIANFFRAPEDPVNLLEIVNYSVVKVLTDTYSLEEVISNQVGKPLTDSYQISDITSTVVEYTREFLEGLNLSDDINGAATDDDQNVIYFKNPSDEYNASDELYSSINKAVQEQYSILDIIFSSVLKPVQDQYSVSDIVFTETNYIRVQEDITNVDDSRFYSYNKVNIDEYNLSDTLVNSLNKVSVDQFNIAEIVQTNFTKTIVPDIFSISDTTSVQADFYRNPTDPTNLGDLVARLVGKPLEEITNLTDILSVTVNYFRSFIDDTNISDSPILIVNYNPEYDDLLVGTDFTEFEAEFYREPEEPLNIIDTSQYDLSKLLLDEYNISDFYISTYNKFVTDQSNVSDNYTRVVSFSREFTDNVGVADNINSGSYIGDTGYFNYSKFLVEQTTVQELIVSDIDKPLPVNQYNINDAISNDISKIPEDLTNISDLTAIQAEFIRTPEDINNISESAIIEYSSELSDSYVISEDIINTVEKPFLDYYYTTDVTVYVVDKVTEDITEIQEVAETQVDFYRDPLDENNIIDIFESVFDKPTEESLNSIDVISFATDYFREALDDTSLSDDTLIINSFIRDIIDINTLSDELLSVIDYIREFDDVLDLQEIVENTVLKELEESFNLGDEALLLTEVNVTDNYELSDTLDTVISYDRELLEELNLSDDIDGSALDDDQNFSYFKNLSDTYSLLDSTLSSVDKGLSEEYYTLSDNLQYDINKAPLDYYNISETFDRAAEFYRDYSDQFNATDLLVSATDFYRNPEETASLTDNTIYSTLKVVIDSNNISEDIASSINKLLSEQTNILDTAATSLSFIRDISDNIFFTDDINGSSVDDSQNFTYFKNITDRNDVVDSFTTSTIKAIQDSYTLFEDLQTAVEKSISDTYRLSDTLLTYVVSIREFTDSYYIAELISVGSNKVFTDQYTLSDTTTQTVNYSRLVTDQSNIFDQFDRQVNYVPSHTDQYRVLDNVSVNVEFNKSYEDLYSAVDILSLALNSVTIDQYNINDTIALSSNKTVLDLTNISDSLDTATSFARTILDQINFSDNIGGATISDGSNFKYSKNEIDQYFVQELLAYQVNKVVSDQFNTTDITALDTNKSVIDVYSVTDSISRQTDYIRNILDQQYVSDTVDTLLVVIREFIDLPLVQDIPLIDFNVGISDSYNTVDEISNTVNKRLNDQTITTDSLNTVLSFDRNFTDQINTSDNLSGSSVDDNQNFIYFKDIQDQTSTIDYTAISTVNYLYDQQEVAEDISLFAGKTISDVYVASDVLERTAEYYRSLTDQFSTSDTVSTQSAFFRSLSDNYSLFDVLVTATTSAQADQFIVNDSSEFSALKSLTDQGSLSDSFTRVLEYNQSLIDQINFSDNIGGATISDGSNFKYSKNETDQYLILEIISNDANKGVLDSQDILDYQELFVNKGPLDQSSLLDNILIDSEFDRVFTDQAGSSDSIGFQNNFYRLFDDQYSILDSITTSSNKQSLDQLNIEDGQYYTVFKELLDTSILSDDLSIDSEFYRSLLDVPRVTQLISLQNNFNRDFEDQYTVSDFVNVVPNKATIEEIGLLDTQYFDILRAPTDTLNIEELTEISYNIGFFDQVYAFEKFSEKDAYEFEFNKISDYLFNDISKVQTDQTSLSDFVLADVTFDREITETASIEETISLRPRIRLPDLLVSKISWAMYTQDYTGGYFAEMYLEGTGREYDGTYYNLYETYKDKYNITDVASLSTLYNRPATENTSVSEDLFIDNNVSPIENPLNFNDNLYNVITKNIFDEINLSENLITLGTGDASPADSYGISDNLYYNTEKTIVDQYSISDSILLAYISGVPLEDIISLTDSLFNTINKNLIDQLNIADEISTQSDSSTTSTDSYNIVDTVYHTTDKLYEDITNTTDTYYSEIVKSILDQLNISDFTTIEKSENAAPQDSSSITDTTYCIVDKSILDQYNIVDSLLINCIFDRQIVDTTSVTSDGIISNQNYVADYFQEGYIGTSLTFT